MFAQLYDINRQSCKERCSKSGRCNRSKGTQTKKGLLAIQRNLQPFDREWWYVFDNTLLKYTKDGSVYSRAREDDYLHEDWQHLIRYPEDPEVNNVVQGVGALGI